MEISSLAKPLQKLIVEIFTDLWTTASDYEQDWYRYLSQSNHTTQEFIEKHQIKPYTVFYSKNKINDQKDYIFINNIKVINSDVYLFAISVDDLEIWDFPDCELKYLDLDLDQETVVTVNVKSILPY
jgi:hypothetical protein